MRLSATMPPRPYSRHRRRGGASALRGGLTMIELVVTLACMAIAAVIVLPVVTDNSAERLRGAAQILVADLEYAQSQSMSHGDNPRMLVITSDKLGYRLATKTTPATAITNPVGGEPYIVRFGAGRASALRGVSVGSYSFGGDDKLGFGVLGQLDQTTAATITLVCGTRSLQLSIDPATGEATLGAVL